MSDLEAAEKVLAQLNDQRDRATEQVTKIEDQRQSLAYRFTLVAMRSSAQN